MTAQCSEEFFEAFRAGIGSYRAECHACGRTHVALECDRWMESEEEQEIREMQAKSPQKVVNTGYEASSYVDLGTQVVHGCACGSERRHEDWVWSHRKQIAAYLHARAKKELQAAAECMLSLKGLGS